jgi:8-oxo-dGTP pyrophosphatase MutT (NUDIX family)
MKRQAAIDFAHPVDGPRNQVGALCWRMHRGNVEVLLITSRETGRWVLPKGWLEPELGQASAAAREAWEEAGVQGEIAAEPMGLFTYPKQLRPGVEQPCVVWVHALRVSRLANRFPERQQRRRKWFRAEKAARRVVEAELRALLLDVAADPDLLTAPAPATQPSPVSHPVPLAID